MEGTTLKGQKRSKRLGDSGGTLDVTARSTPVQRLNEYGQTFTGSRGWRLRTIVFGLAFVTAGGEARGGQPSA
ncbi:hypothetical protein EVAR_27837_1 [Eumeta japonica]|uniref:Uncharacterized protein n=1 Tax=Eumeta variegata TaxID=151549 RepID=A0A4C1VJ90_EUMVA|nr:hypothetical protein EVAR_27837_1 [Eumeta japonica]